LNLGRKVTHKIEIPEQEWDYAWPLGSTAVIITTVNHDGQVNAAGFATCVRVAHGPVFIAFTSGLRNDTHRNVLDTGEFCVNLVPFEQRLMEATRVVGLPFPAGVNELEKAGLTSVPSIVVKPPRVAECHAHFECKVEWTKQWDTRLMVVGRLVAVTMDENCIDENYRIIWDKLRPASFCGYPYQTYFVPSYQTTLVDMVYTDPIPPRPDRVEAMH
jgi:flavin reductase (DIM6/NTAB) family NADH-FMN oxidoreductase RutF